MRYLNKIIFINSATIRYQEIVLDGNVHLIGTQGVGKSTVLRAILFFYNGDTQKLGIPREKKLFGEYYFPFANSFIVYEVQRESGAFSIIVMRSGTGVQFRFVDAAYNPEWIIREQQALERWGDIRHGLDQRGIDSSNRIDRLQEYRDIIYGNTGVLPAYRKYALLESKQYQNIPRTITNVFLNTRLEASFIKETIIQSLSEEELNIDLVRYKHHLRDFEVEFGDIQTFRKKKTQEQAEKVIEAFNNNTRSKADLMRTAAMLGTSIGLAEKEEQKLKAQLEKIHKQKTELQAQQASKEKRRQDQITLIVRDIKVLEDSIRKANSKEREYKEKGIEQALQKSERKQEWESERSRLSAERQTLATKFESIEQQFEVQLAQMQNNLAALANEQKGEVQALQEEFQRLKEQLGQERETETETLAEAYEGEAEGLSQKERKVLEAISKLREERSRTKEREWNAAEIRELSSSIQKAEKAAEKAESVRTIDEQKMDQLKKDWAREEEKLTAAKEAEKNSLQKLLAENEQALAAVKEKLLKYKGALYGYLQEHYPDWQETIGRVAREDLLFQENLDPEVQRDAMEYFYGLKLNLDQVDGAAKSLEQYELEKKKLEEEVFRLRKEIDDLEARFQENGERLKKRFKPKIRQLKDSIQQANYDRDLQHELKKKKELDLEEVLAKAKSEKEAALADIQGQIERQHAQQKAYERERATLKESFAKKKQAIQKEIAKKLGQEQEKLNQVRGDLAKKYGIREAEVEQKIEEIKKNKFDKLRAAGADTERIKTLEEAIGKIDVDLQSIKEQEVLVFGYRKDKAELFDRVEEFKKDRAQKESKREQAERSLDELKVQHAEEIKKINDGLYKLNDNLQKISQGFSDLEAFYKSDLHSEIVDWLQTDFTREVKAYQVRSLIDSLRDISIRLSKFRQDLLDASNRFLSAFAEANLFNFKTKLTVLEDYMTFAADLREFVDENKIAEYEKRVETRFANILNLVGKETGDLISREGEIQKVISKINGDFRTRNFVGVIQSMELKMEDSTNRVVRTLKRIRDYEQERGHELGERNLFNAATADENNLRAVEFLRQLSRDIAEAKQELIRLSDAFELRFRVVENENDSGWVEKLSNVGSEGTDVLVKAMINILLLNVFKESASRKFKDFRLHCMMDEIGRLHPTNVRGILKFANERNILLINGSPVEQDAMAYRHIYELRKDKESHTRITRLITVNNPTPVGNADFPVQ